MSDIQELRCVSVRDTAAPIYFLHIPKTAGTTIGEFLDALYHQSERCGPIRGWSELLGLSPSLLAQKKLIQGHFGAVISSHIEVGLRCFTFLREPLARAVSHYHHVMRDDHHYLHSIAQELGTFSAFLRDARAQPTVANFQLRHLACMLSPIELRKGLRDEQLAQCELERLLDLSPMGDDLEVLIERAKKNLDQMCLVGITEHFNRSFALLCELFEWPAPQQNERKNVNPITNALASISVEDRAFLEELNAADLEIYEYGCTLFKKSWDRSQFTYPILHAFVSYAQNYEDVLLYRGLREVECGFYVDVGAHDPSGDSVTKAFYDRGWHGINIEPSASCYERLCRERQRDINLQVAIGSTNCSATFYEIPGTGLSTLDREIANTHVAVGFGVRETSVTVEILEDILTRYAPPIIHFLKIDVEGSERAVLEGLALSQNRPWVIVVEATVPNTTIANHEQWEHLLCERGYAFVVFDGLNRYYIANEHAELASRFEVLANQTDNFIKYSEHQARQEIRRARWDLRRIVIEQTRMSSQLAFFAEWAALGDCTAESLPQELKNLLQDHAEAKHIQQDQNIAFLIEWSTKLVHELTETRSQLAAGQHELHDLPRQLADLQQELNQVQSQLITVQRRLDTERTVHARTHEMIAAERLAAHARIRDLSLELRRLQSRWYKRLFTCGGGRTV